MKKPLAPEFELVTHIVSYKFWFSVRGGATRLKTLDRPHYSIHLLTLYTRFHDNDLDTVDMTIRRTLKRSSMTLTKKATKDQNEVHLGTILPHP